MGLWFANDDTSQERSNEAVEKSRTSLRIVDKSTDGKYNECLIEDAVLHMQITL